MIVRAQIAIAQDTLFPRDRLVMTPHFQTTPEFPGAGIDFENLANDLATGISGWMVSAASREISVKLYDAQGSVPVYPEADVVKHTGAVFPSKVPRELAICLSFYSGRNAPRRRGRLYVPLALMVSAAGSYTAQGRPTSADMTKVAGLVPIFAGLGGVNIDWVVYSRADNVARKVSDWWVDDEWDTVRSRGLRSISRQTGVTSG